MVIIHHRVRSCASLGEKLLHGSNGLEVANTDQIHCVAGFFFDVVGQGSSDCRGGTVLCEWDVMIAAAHCHASLAIELPCRQL